MAAGAPSPPSARAMRARAEADLDRAAATCARDRATQRQREKKARRDKAGRAAAAKGGTPRILLGARARAGARRAARASVIRPPSRLTGHSEALDAARRQVEVLTPLRHRSAALRSARRPHLLRLRCGDARARRAAAVRSAVADRDRAASGSRLPAPNGSGKTTLLLAHGPAGTLAGHGDAGGRRARHARPACRVCSTPRATCRQLRRRHPGYDGGAGACRRSPASPSATAMRGERADTLSGGERLRAGLAIVTGRTDAAAAAHPRRADQPSRHRCDRSAGSGAKRL